jgi:multicomponent Na+:H+ antiporter subunit C
VEEGAALFRLYGLTAAILFALGLHGVIRSREGLRRVMAVNVMGGGAFLLLVAVARRNWAEGPDPVPHALVLTGIVVALGATALALGLLRRMARHERGAQRR